MNSAEKKFIKVGRLVISFSKVLETWERSTHEWNDEQVSIVRLPNVNIYQSLKNQLLQIDEEDTFGSHTSERKGLRSRLEALGGRLKLVGWLSSFAKRNSRSAA